MVSLPDHLLPAPVGREELPREVREEHQRRRIVEASIDVFAKRGFQPTTVEHLVGASKVGVGTFYGLFEGKEDVFLQAYDRIVADARERLREAAEGDAWPQQAASVLRALVALVAREPNRARLVLVEAQTAGPAALARHEALVDSLAPLLAAARRESPIGDELPQTLEEATVGGVAWLLHWQLLNEGREAIEGLYPELLDIVIAPFFGAEAAAALA